MKKLVTVIKTVWGKKCYCIYGSKRQGFGIEIMWRCENGHMEIAKTPLLFAGMQQAERIAKKLAAGDVHPIHLSDVIRDLLMEEVYEWKNCKKYCMMTGVSN